MCKNIILLLVSVITFFSTVSGQEYNAYIYPTSYTGDDLFRIIRTDGENITTIQIDNMDLKKCTQNLSDEDVECEDILNIKKINNEKSDFAELIAFTNTEDENLFNIIIYNFGKGILKVNKLEYDLEQNKVISTEVLKTYKAPKKQIWLNRIFHFSYSENKDYILMGVSSHPKFGIGTNFEAKAFLSIYDTNFNELDQVTLKCMTDTDFRLDNDKSIHFLEINRNAVRVGRKMYKAEKFMTKQLIKKNSEEELDQYFTFDEDGMNDFKYLLVYKGKSKGAFNGYGP